MTQQSDRALLRTIAIRAMRERGLEPEMPAAALAQADAMNAPARTTEEPTRDLRALLWCSIDNDDSRDLDQLSVAEPLADGAVKVMVAVADVDAAVAKGTPVDRHAARNTTSVYTPAVIFPMLPEKLSTDLTSLADRQDRLAVVVEIASLIKSAGRNWELVTIDEVASVLRLRVYGARTPTRLYLYVDGDLVDTWVDIEASYDASLERLSSGRHAVTARAVDALGRWAGASTIVQR